MLKWDVPRGLPDRAAQPGRVGQNPDPGEQGWPAKVTPAVNRVVSHLAGRARGGAYT